MSYTVKYIKAEHDEDGNIIKGESWAVLNPDGTIAESGLSEGGAYELCEKLNVKLKVKLSTPKSISPSPHRF